MSRSKFKRSDPVQLQVAVLVLSNLDSVIRMLPCNAQATRGLAGELASPARPRICRYKTLKWHERKGKIHSNRKGNGTRKLARFPPEKLVSRRAVAAEPWVPLLVPLERRNGSRKR